MGKLYEIQTSVVGPMVPSAYGSTEITPVAIPDRGRTTPKQRI